MNNKGTQLKFAVLSLSLLTIMAAAAISPSLGAIQNHFSDVNPLFIQMIISVPSLFIALTGLVFPKLCIKFNIRVLTIVALLFYCIGGAVSGLFNNIYLILVTRVYIGISVGIIMPLSTGLLVYYFPKSEQPKLMGMSSAFNQIGALIANVLAGVFAAISWRLSFLVYLIALVPMILVLLYFPKDYFKQSVSENNTGHQKLSKSYYHLVLIAFLFMSAFFTLPSNLSLEINKVGRISSSMVGVILGVMDIFAVIAGILFTRIKGKFKNGTRYIGPICLLIGFCILIFTDTLSMILFAVTFIGLSMGIETPFIFNAASRAGKSAVVTIMPLISIAFYSAQFICPFYVSLINNWMSINVPHQVFLISVVMAVIFILINMPFNEEKLSKLDI